jgi:hypothetical protein
VHFFFFWNGVIIQFLFRCEVVTDAQGKFIQVSLEAIRDLGNYMLGQEMIPQVVKLSCGEGMV